MVGIVTSRLGEQGEMILNEHVTVYTDESTLFEFAKTDNLGLFLSSNLTMTDDVKFYERVLEEFPDLADIEKDPWRLESLKFRISTGAFSIPAYI